MASPTLQQNLRYATLVISVVIVELGSEFDVSLQFSNKCAARLRKR